jgi:uncharacterized repeat protein (TIGR01451 family)
MSVRHIARYHPCIMLKNTLKKMKHTLFPVILVTILTIASAAPGSMAITQAQSITDWPQLSGGPSHAGFTSDPTFATLPQSEGELQLKWKFALNERVEITAQPIVAGGRVYLGLMDGRVLALDATSGRLVWTRTVGGAVPNTLAYAGGRVYFGAEDGIIYALSATDGAEVWRCPTGGPILSAAVVVGDTAYIGSSDGYLYAINANDGTVRWRFEAIGPVLTSPAVGNGRVYFGAENAAADPATPYPVAYAVDTSGNRVWSRTLTGLSLRHTYPVLDEASDTVIYRTVHPGWRGYGPTNDWTDFSPFQHPCTSEETEPPTRLVAGWDSYYQTYPERRAFFFLRASDGTDKWDPTSHTFPALPPPPYWSIILPLVDDQHRAWFPTVGACNAALEHDWRLWRVNLLTGRAEQVATQSQFTVQRDDEVGRPILAGSGGQYRYYNTIDADLGVYAPGVGQWYLFGRDGFYNHNYPLDSPPTLHLLRYSGAWMAGNVPSPSPPVITNGVLHFSTFGWLYAVEPGSSGHGHPQPPSLTPPDPASPPVPEPIPPIHPTLGDGSPAAIRAALNAQVAGLIAHGPPTPSAKLYGWQLSALYAYWHPPETLYALAQALPYLEEPLRSQTIIYLQTQADVLLYNPAEYQYQRRCIVYGKPGVQVGDAACGRGIRASWLQNDPNLIAWRLVAMREIARQTDDWSDVQENWNFVRDKFYSNNTGLSTMFNETLGFSLFEDWRVDSRLYLQLQVMASDAVAEMADHVGDTATRNRTLYMKSRMLEARLRHGQHVQSLYDSGQLDPLPYPVDADGTFDNYHYFLSDPSIAYSLLPYETEVNRNTDVRQVMWEDAAQTIYEPSRVYRSWDEMYAYRPLNQEIADWLAANLHDETTRYLRALEFGNPWWFWGASAHNLMGLGEELYASPHLAFGIFQVEARVMQGDALFGNQPAHNYNWLVRHLPWPYGQPAWRDIYHLQNLVALLERASKPDLSASTKSASIPAPRSGQTVTYTIAIRNNGSPLTYTIRLTDTVPAGLSYVPGSLAATSGTPDDSDAPTLYWSGVLSNTSAVNVTYLATVTVPASTTQYIVNTVTISTQPAGVFTRTAMVIANGRTFYLPVVFRGAS